MLWEGRGRRVTRNRQRNMCIYARTCARTRKEAEENEESRGEDGGGGTKRADDAAWRVERRGLGRMIGRARRGRGERMRLGRTNARGNE